MKSSLQVASAASEITSVQEALLAPHTGGVYEAPGPEVGWLRVLSTEANAHETGLRPVLSSVSAAGIPMWVVLTGSDEGVSWHIGIHGNRLGWLMDSLAPQFMTSPADPFGMTESDPVHFQFGATLMPSSPAGTGGDGDQRDPVRAVEMLDVIKAAWCLSLQLRPVRQERINEDRRAAGRIQTDTASQQPGAKVDVRRQHLADHLADHLAMLDSAAVSGGFDARLALVVDRGPRVDSGSDPTSIAALVAASLAAGLSQGPRNWSVTWGNVADRSQDGERLNLLPAEDVSFALATPSSTLGKITHRPPGPRGRPSRDRSSGHGWMRLGDISGTSRPFDISVTDLVGHGFICGTTGSGKSWTVTGLLSQLWNEHRIPFLLIDPAKADYGTPEAPGLLMQSIGRDLRVVDASELRMSVLQPLGTTSIDSHLGMLADAFCGSFAMPTPVPYIFQELVKKLLDIQGMQPALTLHDASAVFDTMNLGYGGEVASNIRASLVTRLRLLTTGPSAVRLCAPSNERIQDLLTGSPTVITLASIGDEGERSFIMTMLAMYVSQAARLRPPSGRHVQHVLALEEAHRIMPQVGPASGDSLSVDPRAVAARMLEDMLKELRSTGESVLVIDQSPAAVARDVIANTNLKITHRVVDPRDQEAMGGAMGLHADQWEGLGALPQGQAYVSNLAINSPTSVTVTWEPATRQEGRPDPSAQRAASVDDRYPCCDTNKQLEDSSVLDRAQAARIEALHHRVESTDGIDFIVLLLVASQQCSDAQQAHVYRTVIEERATSLVSTIPGADPRGLPTNCAVFSAARRTLLSLIASNRITAQEGTRRFAEFTTHWLGAPDTTKEWWTIARTADWDSRPFALCATCPTPCLWRPFQGLVDQRTRTPQGAPPDRRGAAVKALIDAVVGQDDDLYLAKDGWAGLAYCVYTHATT